MSENKTKDFSKSDDEDDIPGEDKGKGKARDDEDSEDEEESDDEVESASVRDLIEMTLPTLDLSYINKAVELIEHIQSDNPMVTYEAFNLLVQLVINQKNTHKEALDKFENEITKYQSDYMNYSTQKEMKTALNKKYFAYQYANKAVEGSHECPSCKSTETVARRAQLSAGDESTAFLLRCTRCNYSGRSQ